MTKKINDMTKDKLTLALITPSFNQHHYVKAMLNSVVIQTVKPIQHIILDGGSTDGTIEILKEYQSNNSNVILHIGRDKGQADAINIGFHEANADIIAWLNTDDRYVADDVFSHVIKIFESNHEIDVVYGEGNFVDSNWNFIRKAYINVEPDILNWRFANSVGILQPALFLRKSVFDSVGDLSVHYNLSFDYEYWIRIAKMGYKFYFTKKVLCEAILHKDSKTIGQRNKQLIETIKMVKQHYGFITIDWINRLSENTITGFDGISTTNSKISADQISKTKELFEFYNNDNYAIATILSNSWRQEIRKTFQYLKGTALMHFENVIITAFNTKFFHEGLTLITQIARTTTLSIPILVYDLGLAKTERAVLENIIGVFVIDLPLDDPKYFIGYFTPKTYGFKSYIAWHAGEIFNANTNILWIDAGIAPIKDIISVFEKINKDDVLFIDHSDKWNSLSNCTFITNECIQDMRVTNRELASHHIRAGVFGYKVEGKFQKLINQVYHYSLNPRIITGEKHAKSGRIIPNPNKLNERIELLCNPYKADKYTRKQLRDMFGYAGHKHDQTILSILAARYDAPIQKAEEYCISDDASSKVSFQNWFGDDHIKEYNYSINPFYSTSKVVFMQHRGLYINHHGIPFGISKNDKAIILGNGPSIKELDFNLFDNYHVFGMNAAYRYWLEINWFPKYYSCLDIAVGRSHADEILDLINNAHEYGIKLFLLREELINQLKIKSNFSRVISFDKIAKGLMALNTPTITTGSHTAAWAAWLGYHDIYMMGVDNNYVEVVDGAKRVKGHLLQMAETPKENPNYFFNDYHRKGDQYFVPNPNRAIHLESWREVAACLRDTEVRLVNANLLSKVDAVDFCHFADVAAGIEPEIIPRGWVVLTNHLRVHIDTNRTQEAEFQNRTLLLHDNANTFPIHPFLKDGWQVVWQNAPENVKRNTINRYGDHAVLFNEDASKLDISPDYIHWGSTSGLSVETHPIPGETGCRPAAFTIEITAGADHTQRQTQAAYIQQWEELKYQLLVLGKNNFSKDQTVNNMPEYRLLPYNEQRLMELESGWLIGLRKPLASGELMDAIHGLDLQPVHQQLTQGFVFHAISHTEGVTLEGDTAIFNQRKRDDFYNHTFRGKVHPGELVEMEVNFNAAAAANLLITLCRDGNTPFEHTKRKVFSKPGINSVKLSTRFTVTHHGVRLQISSTEKTVVLSHVTTRLQIARSQKPVMVEGSYHENTPVVLVNDDVTKQQKKETKHRIPLKTKIKRKGALLFWSGVNRLFPVESASRAKLAQMKRKVYSRFGF